MSLQELKKILRQHIGNNRLAKFFEDWEAEVSEDAEISNLFILKRGQWKQLENESMIGLLSYSEKSQKNAVLVNDLLGMAGRLEETDLRRNAVASTSTSHPSTVQGSNEELIKLIKDKIEYLRRRHVIESGASAKYQLTQEIAEAEADLQRLLNA